MQEKLTRRSNKKPPIAWQSLPGQRRYLKLNNGDTGRRLLRYQAIARQVNEDTFLARKRSRRVFRESD